MNYYFSRTLDMAFDESVAYVVDALKREGFGIVSDIDVQATLKQKIGVDFRPYRILGACNPTLAHEALLAEDKVGTMLPCNVVVQAWNDHSVEVAAIDPLASMQAIANPALEAKARDVRARLRKVVDSL